MPAEKNSAGPVEGLAVLPASLLPRLSNSSPHNPLMAIGALVASSTFPRKCPVTASNAAIVPPNLLPISKLWLKNPKSCGASATPQGACSHGPASRRSTSLPLAVKTSTNPPCSPQLSAAPFLVEFCIAYVTTTVAPTACTL